MTIPILLFAILCVLGVGFAAVLHILTEIRDELAESCAPQVAPVKRLADEIVDDD